MYNFKTQTYFKIFFFISIISLTSAYFIEYVLGYQPCNLCLIERIPYGLTVFLIILNYISRIDEKFIILLLSLTFAFSLIISFYHFGIEQGFFKESSICGVNNTKEILSKEELLREKFSYLRKLEQLEKKGVELTKKYTIDSNLMEMMGEYELIVAEKEKQNSVKFQGNMLSALINGVEFLNGKFDPFDFKLDVRSIALTTSVIQE